MKKELHPSDYRPVVFQDSNAKFALLTKSTAKTSETIKWEDGQEYPLVTVHISSASHPFYTGEEKIMDIEGRVDKFKSRQAAAEKQRAAMMQKAKKRADKKASKSSREVQKIGANRPKPQAKKPAPKTETPATPAAE